MTTRCSTNWDIGARNTSILKPTSYWIQFQSSNHFPYTVIIRADNRTQVNQYSSLKTNSCITLSPRQISYARNTMWNLCSLEGWDALQSVWIFQKKSGKAQNISFYGYLLSCQAFELKWGWGWPWYDANCLIDVKFHANYCLATSSL